MAIHPTAIIDPRANLDSDVEVGAYTVIGPDVTIGSGCRIGPHVVIEGPTTIGRDNHIFQFASIGAAPQDLKYKGEPTRLEIGDRNSFRENCTINRGTTKDKLVTRIANDNLFMAGSHVGHEQRVHTVARTVRQDLQRGGEAGRGGTVGADDGGDRRLMLVQKEHRASCRERAHGQTNRAVQNLACRRGIGPRRMPAFGSRAMGGAGRCGTCCTRGSHQRPPGNRSSSLLRWPFLYGATATSLFPPREA